MKIDLGLFIFSVLFVFVFVTYVYYLTRHTFDSSDELPTAVKVEPPNNKDQIIESYHVANEALRKSLNTKNEHIATLEAHIVSQEEINKQYVEQLDRHKRYESEMIKSSGNVAVLDGDSWEGKYFILKTFKDENNRFLGSKITIAFNDQILYEDSIGKIDTSYEQKDMRMGTVFGFVKNKQ